MKSDSEHIKKLSELLEALTIRTDTGFIYRELDELACVLEKVDEEMDEIERSLKEAEWAAMGDDL